MLQGDAHTAGSGSLADYQVEGEVLHCRVEDFLDDARQPVDLVHEEQIACLKICEHGSDVAGPLDRRPGGGADVDAHLGADDVRQRCLAESRRTVEQQVIEPFSASERRLDADVQVVFDFFLADIVGEVLRPQRGVEPLVLELFLAGDQPLVRFVVHRARRCRCCHLHPLPDRVCVRVSVHMF